MTEKEKELLVKSNMAQTTERVKTCFGVDGRKKMPCDNKCGADIAINSFNVFMLPEEKDYKVLLVCLACCKKLLIQYDYTIKN